MGYRIIETTTLNGRKRVQRKSTGHNGDQEQRERNLQTALARPVTMPLNQIRELPHKPRHLPRAGS